jgi:outer membrane protein OmpA-like peptidoglycan-associated protein
MPGGESRARRLQAQLRDVEASKTDRGMVIALGDVLFDTNRAQLNRRVEIIVSDDSRGIAPR